MRISDWSSDVCSSDLAEAGLIRFADQGEVIEHCILSGGAKLQWKVDWAMRWVALDVDYEMYGKDLTDSGIQSGKIAKALSGRKPEGQNGRASCRERVCQSV